MLPFSAAWRLAGTAHGAGTRQVSPERALHPMTAGSETAAGLIEAETVSGPAPVVNGAKALIEPLLRDRPCGGL
jgi:hypothetical protein